MIRFLGSSLSWSQQESASVGGMSASLASEQSLHTEEPAAPGFQAQTFASALPEYTSNESGRIRAAFNPHNYVSLAKLPHQFKPDTVNKARQETIHSNLVNEMPPKPARKTMNNHGLFHSYEYIPSKISLQEDLQRQERRVAEAKMYEVASQTFVPSSSTKTLKHENPWDNKEFKYPYMDDPYSAAEDQQRRMKWIAESRVLHGPFLLSGRANKGSAIATRKLLPDIVKQLHETLKEDWGTCNFSVMVDETDHIIARFELATVDSSMALMGYFNTLAMDNSQALASSRWYTRYQLRKVVEDWGRQEGGLLYFMFRPPWVASNPMDTFLTLHPEARRVPSKATFVPGRKETWSPGGTKTTTLDGGKPTKSRRGKAVNESEDSGSRVGFDVGFDF